MSKTVLVVFAHPEPSSLTRQLATTSVQTLTEQGHTVLQSDLYQMQWKATFDAADFPARSDTQRLNFIAESQHAYASGQQTADVAAEQQKLLAADAVIFHFPLWWFAMPAILKGWFDRVYAYGFAYGYRNAGNRYRYGDGVFAGKRALLSVMVGGPQSDYSPRGINGPLDELLFPVTHGTLFFPGFEVLPTHAIYGAGKLDQAATTAAIAAWQLRLTQLFDEQPIPFRRQNSAAYQDNQLHPALAAGATGINIHSEQIK